MSCAQAGPQAGSGPGPPFGAGGDEREGPGGELPPVTPLRQEQLYGGLLVVDGGQPHPLGPHPYLRSVTLLVRRPVRRRPQHVGGRHDAGFGGHDGLSSGMSCSVPPVLGVAKVRHQVTSVTRLPGSVTR